MPRRSPLASPIIEPDDDALVRAAQAGDRDALERLLRAHVDRIHALCRRLCGDDAQDAAQDALVAVVRGLPRFDHRSAFSTWVHRVTTNACLDELRRRGRRPKVVARLDTGRADDGAGAALDPPDPAAGPDEAVAERLAIDDALAALPDEFRTAVVLRDQLGLDYAEIAEVLGIPPGTVRSRIARGRARLVELLDPSGGGGNRAVAADVQGTET